MIGALVILAVLVVVGFLLWWFDRRRRPGCAHSLPKKEKKGPADAAERPEGCCGMHAVCEKGLSLSPTGEKPVYFDDEELDIYRGRDPKSYTQAETEQFRDVLLTLRPDEVPAWARSIQMRGVALPDDVREELLLIVGELREHELEQPKN